MKPPTLAPAFASYYPILCEVAREHGYCLALHGTMARDLDLLAVPWTDEAVPAEELVEALWGRICWISTKDKVVTGPEDKPHGRRAWCLPMMGGAYMDLSVMPRVAP